MKKHYMYWISDFEMLETAVYSAYQLSGHCP